MFKYVELKIPKPNFDSNILSLILQLEILKAGRIFLDVNPILFYQVNKIFHSIESIQSARIEGNRTTLSDYFKVKLDTTPTKTQNIEEIQNIEHCIKYIDSLFDEDKYLKISEKIIRDLHAILTKNLKTEGSITPGKYRTGNVYIQNSKHTPPLAIKVQEYMNELIEWINKDTIPQEKPLKIAIAHHRFTWIHPFDNGNGRMSRLITYFLLRQYGYKMSYLMNLSAIFCIDREKYFNMLELADTGEDTAILQWCEYVLSGLHFEIAKMQKLLNKEYFVNHIVEPVFSNALARNLISDSEYKILKKSLNIKGNLIMLKDLKPLFKDKTDRQINLMIQQMLKNNLLEREKAKSRKYILCLENNIFIYDFIKILEDEHFINIK